MSRPLRKDSPKPSPALNDNFSSTGREYREELKNSTRNQQSKSRLNFDPHLRNVKEKGACQAVLNNALDLKRNDGEERTKSYTKPFIWDRTNSAAPTVTFRKTRKTKGHVDDIIFINLLQQVRFIAEHFQQNEKESEISDDWTFVAMVLDRLFLIIFSVLNVGTMFIILEAPSLYDYSEAMNITLPSKPLGQANLFSSHTRNL
ncbi:hypothetical protein KIN20_025614 [Parelaphostrongylus tenuis]|uniref:Neurotransmitter-gated ion-channel transmembrane domain-containing protein n=1 Tax=Parelaphostrongylus tenuis TaxID=148309 RepID=A0AAD5MZN5_PARTN|nr:hypothetical protein KIN20_025614 [Parelaphostrongylus tenuis]